MVFIRSHAFLKRKLTKIRKFSYGFKGIIVDKLMYIPNAMIVHTSVDYNRWFKRLDIQLTEPTYIIPNVVKPMHYNSLS